MGGGRHSECGENGICARECSLEGGAIAERLDHNNARSVRHVRNAFWSRPDDGRETHSSRSAHTEYSLAETSCGADDGRMIRHLSRPAGGSTCHNV